MSFVSDSTTKILRDALINFSNEARKNEEEKLSNEGKTIVQNEITARLGASKFQLIISTTDNETCEPIYSVMNNGNPYMRKNREDEITNIVAFNEIIGVKFDFLQREERSKPIMIAALQKFAKELVCDPDRIMVMIMTTTDDVKKVEPFLFLWVKNHENKMVQVRQLDINEDILDDPDPSKPKTKNE
jgi:hypothetical protein